MQRKYPHLVHEFIIQPMLFQIICSSRYYTYNVVFALQVHPKWDIVKVEVMYRALKCKFSSHSHLKTLLLSTVGSVLVESSPHDLFWGGGRDGEGLNYLGRLLMQLRSQILAGQI